MANQLKSLHFIWVAGCHQQKIVQKRRFLGSKPLLGISIYQNSLISRRCFLLSSHKSDLSHIQGDRSNSPNSLDLKAAVSIGGVSIPIPSDSNPILVPKTSTYWMRENSNQRALDLAQLQDTLQVLQCMLQKDKIGQVSPWKQFLNNDEGYYSIGSSWNQKKETCDAIL